MQQPLNIIGPTASTQAQPYDIMKTFKRIVVVGFGTAGKSEDGTWQAKEPIADYINGLALEAGEVVWAAPISGLSADALKAKLDSQKVRFIPARRNLEFYRRILRECKGAAVILHMPASTFLWPVYRLIKKHSVALAAYFGDDFEEHCKGGKGLDVLKLNLFLRAHRSLIRHAGLVIVRGKHLEKVARQYNTNVIQTVPLAHMPKSVQRKPLPRSGDPWNLLCVSKLNWRKGLRELIDAYDALASEKPERIGSLTIIGNGNDLPEIKKYAATKASGSNITFTGYISLSKELELYWQQANLLVMPTSEHKEGVPRVIDEALSRGLGVVSTTIGGIGDEFANGEVLLVPPADAHALKEAILQLVENEPHIESMLQLAASRFEYFQQEGTPAQQHYRSICQAS